MIKPEVTTLRRYISYIERQDAMLTGGYITPETYRKRVRDARAKVIERLQRINEAAKSRQ